MSGRPARKFQGKNPYKDLREFKSKEIKKSLVHRARLRKNYFKILEQEGETVPQKASRDKAQEDNENFSTQSQDNFKEKKSLDYSERIKITKERKERARLEKLREIQQRRQAIESKNKEREKKKERLNQRTKTGQPKMGPRITDLLEKIKVDLQ